MSYSNATLMILYVREFTQNEQLHPETRWSRSIRFSRIFTETISDGHVVQVTRQLRCCSEHTNPRKNTKTKIPNCHCVSPIPCGSFLHNMLPPNNQEPVNHNSCNWKHWMFAHPSQYRNGIIFLFKTAENWKSKCALDFIRECAAAVWNASGHHDEKCCFHSL